MYVARVKPFQFQVAGYVHVCYDGKGSSCVYVYVSVSEFSCLFNIHNFVLLQGQ